ncbi:hypothetical protein [Spirosoma foliorum]|uniref:hypothetical protein n=1 Tax=Spirosoma foliorum TaxID=2710596 RepID=UPI001F0A7FDF|nr:hypothetical protein [Spirosoma foliorum]
MGTIPITALFVNNASSVAGSLSLGALAGEWSVLSSLTKAAFRSVGRASTSKLTPAFSASSTVSLAAFIPWGMRTASVQKPSSPNVSLRYISRPASMRPAPTESVAVWAVVLAERSF